MTEVSKRSSIVPPEAEKYRPYFEEGWFKHIWPFLLSDDYKRIKGQLKAEIEAGIKITPNVSDMFNAFKLCAYNDLKVIMVGQDPYPEEGVAHGLAFSSAKPKLPKSLGIIYRGIEEDVYKGLNLNMVKNPNLTFLAKQGVLLLNTSLTTHVGKTGAHMELWRPFMKFIGDVLSDYNPGLIINLWGQHAKKFEENLVPYHHWYLYAEHPIAASYRGGLWDHRDCFTRTNNILLKHNGKEAEIKWDECEFIKEENDSKD